MRRIATAVVLVPLVTYVVLFGPQPLLAAVIAAVAAVCMHEYSGIVSAQGFEPPGLIGYSAGFMLLFVHQWELLFVVVLTMAALGMALRFGDLAKALPYAGALVVGVVYIFGSWRCGIELRAISPHWLFFALVLNWIGDTAAFYVGKNFGRHKLAPVASPKKTWEGAIASVVGSMIFGYFYAHQFLPEVPWLNMLLLSAVANVAGQFGDLSESALKRGAGVKDSGTSLPGHGGWLDRVDSSLFAMPVVYLYTVLA